MKRAMAFGALLIALTACGSDDDVPDVESEEASPSPTPSASPPPTTDPLRACELMGDGGDESVFFRIPGALSSVGSEVTDEQVDELLDIHSTIEDATELGDVPLSAALTKLNVPFAQFHEVVRQGGGDVSLDTSTVMVDVQAVMELCIDAGYTVSD